MLFCILSWCLSLVGFCLVLVLTLEFLIFIVFSFESMCFIVSWFINVNLLANSIICGVADVGVDCILFVVWIVVLCFKVGAL